MVQIFDSSENIVTLLGLESLPEEKRIALVEDAIALVERRVTLRLMELLPESDIAAAEALADKPEELFAFLSKNVPDLPALIAEEVSRVRGELVVAGEAARASAE